MTWIRNGIKYAKVRSRGGRWGPSKVHVGKWHRSTGGYEPLCDYPKTEGAFIGHGYSREEDDAIVTCKKCLKNPYWKKREKK